MGSYGFGDVVGSLGGYFTRGFSWDPNGLTKAEATPGKPEWAKQRQRRHMGNPNGPTEAEATHGKPNELTETEATHGKPKGAKHRQRRHMGNPNGHNTGRGDTWETQIGLTKAEATYGKPEWADQGKGDTWKTQMG
jgi:hypothetical protein